MSEVSYMGLFHLTGGAFLFFGMFALFREWGWRAQSHDMLQKEEGCDKWAGVDELTINNIIEETHDIKTFRLERSNGGLFPEFHEGQFITFQIGNKKDKVMRSYSISSSSHNRKIVSISIKKINDGKGSGWFHSLGVGDKVVAYTPSGLFTSFKEREGGQDLVFVAGGIGITPFMSMIQSAVDIGSKTHMHLFYGMRTTRDMAFHKELEALDKRYKNVHYYPILSEADDSWSGEKGYVTFDFIKSKVSSLNEAKYYFCGPPVMTDTISEQLLSQGISEDQLHSEKFASPVSMDESQIQEVEAQITYNGEVHSYKSKKTVLEYLEDQNVSMNFSCRVGVCGVCKCKLKSGKVNQFSDSGLTSEDKKQGYILTCVARPEEDIEIEG